MGPMIVTLYLYQKNLPTVDSNPELLIYFEDAQTIPIRCTDLPSFFRQLLFPLLWELVSVIPLPKLFSVFIVKLTSSVTKMVVQDKSVSSRFPIRFSRLASRP